ncbi:MAG: hypothetical protein JXA20_10565 [Spirochaetes bacterium]|nr:hypothetical protein [Spirochaetota bacterium]
MKYRNIALTLVLPVLAALWATVSAVPADTCAVQRALFPARWDDTAGERVLMRCWGHYIRPVIRVSAPDRRGLRHLSVTADESVFRAIIDTAQYGALAAGRSTRLFLKSETSCSIRGNTSGVVYLDVSSAGGRILVKGSLDEIDSCEILR